MNRGDRVVLQNKLRARFETNDNHGITFKTAMVPKNSKPENYEDLLDVYDNNIAVWKMHACKTCKKIISSHNSMKQARNHARKCKKTSDIFKLPDHKELNITIEKKDRKLIHDLCTNLSSKALLSFGVSKNKHVMKLLDVWGRLCLKYKVPLQPVDVTPVRQTVSNNVMIQGKNIRKFIRDTTVPLYAKNLCHFAIDIGDNKLRHEQHPKNCVFMFKNRIDTQKIWYLVFRVVFDGSF